MNMKKGFVVLASALLLGFVCTANLEAALTLKAESLAFAGADSDLVSSTGAAKDGKKDAVFSLMVSGAQAIKEISLKNDTTGQLWSTTPASGQGLLLVRNSKGELLNKTGRMAVTPVVLAAEFTLIINDAAASIPKDSAFTVKVTLIDKAATSTQTTVKAIAAPTPEKKPDTAQPAKAEEPGKAEIALFENNGESEQDLTGPGKKIGADGKNDYQFTVRFKLPKNISIKGLQLTAENGSKKLSWDTVTSNRTAALAVVSSAQDILNKTDGSVSFTPAAGSACYLFISDREGILASPKTTVTLKASLSDGKLLEAKAVRGKRTVAKDTVVPEFRGTGKYDFVGEAEKPQANMNADSFISITVNETGTITGLRVQNMKNGQIWDTVPGNGNYLAFLLSAKGDRLNASDGALNVKVNGETEFHVAFDETKDQATGPYKVTLLFADGRLIEGTTKGGTAAAAPAEPAQTAERKLSFVSKKPAAVALDVVGKNKKKGANGSKDMALTIAAAGNGVIKAIVLTASNGTGWDTLASNNGRWLLGVREGNKLLNAKNGTVKITVKGTKTLQLLMQNNGTLTKKNGLLNLTVTWANGEVSEASLKW
mgnify:CR=1 FL=1